nr:uncharacterized protein LOC109189197 [Ipomoea trifida]
MRKVLDFPSESMNNKPSVKLENAVFNLPNRRLQSKALCWSWVLGELILDCKAKPLVLSPFRLGWRFCGDMMKLGHFDWNPSKEVYLDGTWQKFVDKG